MLLCSTIEDGNPFPTLEKGGQGGFEKFGKK